LPKYIVSVIGQTVRFASDIKKYETFNILLFLLSIFINNAIETKDKNVNKL
jgi:hypothetical protein